MTYTRADGSSATFYYVLNAQGDVLSLINSAGTIYTSYTYDAWGNVLTAQSYNSNYPYLHSVNPLRYRGYYYDSETGWYYLQSRYYDPAIGRFINADDIVIADNSLTGLNLFSYCENNPVSGYDPTGEWNWGGFAAGVALFATGALIVAATIATGGTVLVVLAGAAVAATGSSLGYAAATNGTFTADLSLSYGHGKAGVSLVIDFGSNNHFAELYGHIGTTSTAEFGMSYSTGIVRGYSGPGSYSGGFFGGGISGYGYGIEGYTSSDGKVRSYTATFSPCASSKIEPVSSCDMYYAPVALGGDKKYYNSYTDYRGFPCSHA